jgi:Uma2 family endonuclease
MAITTPIVMLESGDRLSRAEFHRRYSLRTDLKRAELVRGVVYVPSPTRFSVHDERQGDIATWLGIYGAQTPGVRRGLSATIYLSEDSEVQPDGFLIRVPPPNETAARVTDDDYIEGAPQLVVEVAASSVSYDLHDKLRAYERAGVLEYIVWRVLDEAIDWFRLESGAYRRVEPNERGVIESAAFPGLRLHVAKLLAGDMPGVLAELENPAGD